MEQFFQLLLWVLYAVSLLREEHKFQVSGNEVLMKIFGIRNDEIDLSG